jgi:hypothetical protein
LPSKRTTVEPTTRPDTQKFHIIHPVVVNQKNRSPSPRSKWKPSALACSSRIPPWPWTIGFGFPVVPDENRMYSGWSNSTGSCSSGAIAAVNSAQSDQPAGAACSGSRYGSHTPVATVGNPARIDSASARRSIVRSP